MFTGIIAELGTVDAVEGADEGARLRIRAELATELEPGDSVAVNGVCLTAVGPDAEGFGADVMHETLRRSSLAEVRPGRRVNIELPLRADERLGGHVVQGHVDGLGRIGSVEAEGDGLRVVIEAPPEILRYCVEKGSITVDGVSLTVAELLEDAFAVALVPHTLTATTLGEVVPGQPVNLEVDVLAKYVERLVDRD